MKLRHFLPLVIPLQVIAIEQPATDVALLESAENANSVRVSRYILKDTQLTEQELNPLANVGTFSIPRDLRNVGDAIQYTLNITGYTAVKESDEFRILKSLTLPESHREIATKSVIDAVQLLAGPAFVIEVDHLLRRLHFKSKHHIDHAALATLETPRRQPIASTAGRGTTGVKSYWVKKGDSLSQIANEVGIDGSQFGLWTRLVLGANQDAFIDDDINLLRANVLLTLP